MTETPDEGRQGPLVRSIVLLVGFVLIVVAAVFTVLIPALEDDPADQTGTGDESAEAAESEESEEGAEAPDP